MNLNMNVMNVQDVLMTNVSKVANSVQKLTQQTISEANKVKDKIQDKIVDIQTQDEVHYGSLWEPIEDIFSCRGCLNKIQTRKHHCRACGGVFCDDCSPAVPPNSYERTLLPSTLPLTEGQTVRICMGCRRGECPSSTMKEKVRKILDDEKSRLGTESNKHLEKVNAKVNEAMGVIFNDIDVDDHTVRAMRLFRGSFYGENGMTNLSAGRPVAVSGYFEFFNKSTEVVAVKIVVSEVDVRGEIPRPSYFAVPPGDSVYGFFNGRSTLHLFLLFENPNRVSSKSALVYDTNTHGVHPERISDCAKIELFTKAKVLTYRVSEKNVLLKYKGDGLVVPRAGNNVGRVGLVGRMQGRRFSEGKIDYSTNVTQYDFLFTL